VDQAARIRIADELFGGQGGEQFVALINGGAKALADFRKEAHDLGMVMSTDLVKQTVEAKIELDNLSKVISSQFAIVVAELSPDIQAIAESMMNWVREQRALKDLGMDNFFDTLADSLGRVASALSTIAKYSGLRSVLDTMSQAAELSKQGLLDMTEFVKLSFLERQKLVDDILRKQNAIAGNAKYLTGGLDDFVAPMLPEVVVTASGGGGGGDKPKAPPPLPDSDPLGIWRGGPMVLNPDAIATMESAHQRYLAIMAEMSTETAETYDEMSIASQTWVDGAIAGLAEYNAAATDTFQNASDFFGHAMGTMEDELVDFATTAKFEFTDLIDSIIADLLRLMVRQAITGPLAGALAGVFGGGGGTQPLSVTSGVSYGTAFGATGGVFSGPSSGYPAVMHGTEAIVPLSGGRSIPVEMKGGGTVVNIHNHSGAEATVKESQTGDGLRQLDIYIANSINRMGPSGRAISQRFGVQPKGMA